MTYKNWKDILLPKVQDLVYCTIILVLILISQLCFSNDENSQFSSGVKISAENPTIEFIYVPPYGSSEDLAGRVRNADPDSFNVAVYILVGAGWWTKSTFAEPLTSIKSDSTWITDITTGGNDAYATQIHAFLLPLGVDPPLSSGLLSLPASLDTISVADVDTVRNPRSIHFSGYEWWVKASVVPVGPGPNYFSDSTENVWVDDENQLHLNITKRNGRWYCAEVILNESLGYGNYIFKIVSKVGQINENAVIGLFTWDDYAPAEFYREIDIEFSRWGVESDPNAQYVVQPWDYPGNLQKWVQPLSLNSSTHCFDWQPDNISFLSVKGHQISAPYDSVIYFWKYTGPNIPKQGSENARINLWLFYGQPPTDNSEIEVIISNFEHSNITSVDNSDMTQHTQYSLLQNYPNPFNSSTCIRYSILAESFVKLKVYDLLGREVAVLVHERKLPGEYEITWQAKDLPSGIYFYRIETGGFLETKKLLLLK